MKAFPRGGSTYDSKVADDKGMDLRDYFAAQAIQAIISVAKGSEIGIDNGAITEDTHRAARCAFAIADAMMEARK
jgi:hypothetical protein